MSKKLVKYSSVVNLSSQGSVDRRGKENLGTEQLLASSVALTPTNTVNEAFISPNAVFAIRGGFCLFVFEASCKCNLLNFCRAFLGGAVWTQNILSHVFLVLSDKWKGMASLEFTAALKQQPGGRLIQRLRFVCFFLVMFPTWVKSNTHRQSFVFVSAKVP